MPDCTQTMRRIMTRTVMSSTRVLCSLVLSSCLALPAWAQGSAPASAAPGAAVVSASKNLAPGFAGLNVADKLVLVPMDVELFELGVGGVTEPKAEWTAAAQQHMKAAIAARQAKLALGAVELSERDADEFAEPLSLHAAVAQSVAFHHLGLANFNLPTKAGQLDWSFGEAMQGLGQKTGARYGLFIWVRDYYASAERKAMMVGLALLGVVVPGGAQLAYASLVDLQTGRVVWFNKLVRGHGDLREAKPAEESVEALLANFPTVR